MSNFKDLNINRKINILILTNLVITIFGFYILNTYLDYFLLNIEVNSVFQQIILFGFFLILASLLQYGLFKYFIINPIKTLLLHIEKSKDKNSFTKINTQDEIGKISIEFSLIKEMLKNEKTNTDNIIRIKTAEIELANEELKNLNLQSEKREKFLETLFEAIPFPIFYKNEHFRYIKCNNAFAEYLGKSKKDIYGKTVFDLANPRLAEIYHKKDKDLFNNGSVQKYDSVVEDNEGNIRTVTFNKSLCIYNDKKIGIVGLIIESPEKKN